MLPRSDTANTFGEGIFHVQRMRVLMSQFLRFCVLALGHPWHLSVFLQERCCASHADLSEGKDPDALDPRAPLPDGIQVALNDAAAVLFLRPGAWARHLVLRIFPAACCTA